MKLKFNKRLFLTVGLAISIVFCILAFNMSLSLKRELGDLKAQQRELLVLKEECLLLKNRIEAVEGKRSHAKVEGIVQATDEIFQSLGLKQKVKSVKATGSKEIRDGLEEEAEVRVEKVDMNEMINLFYKIENAPMVLKIKRTTVKTSFENPASLNITMVISLIKAK